MSTVTLSENEQRCIFWNNVSESLEPYVLPMKKTLGSFEKELPKGKFVIDVEQSKFIFVSFMKTIGTKLTEREKRLILQITQQLVSHFPELTISSMSDFEANECFGVRYYVKPKSLIVPKKMINKRKKEVGGLSSKIILSRLAQLNLSHPHLVISRDWPEDVREAATIIGVPLEKLLPFVKI